MITIYHNPRCAKSREALHWLEEKEKEVRIVRYLDEGLTPDLLEDLLNKLAMSAEELIRKKEKVWRAQYAHLDLNEDELIMVMVEEPRLMERPVVVKDDRAIVARPAELLADFLS